jgi:signal recognition particle GTPase
MFDTLSDKLQGVFSGLRGRGKLTSADIDQAMRAIRLSLLEASACRSSNSSLAQSANAHAAPRS